MTALFEPTDSVAFLDAWKEYSGLVHMAVTMYYALDLPESLTEIQTSIGRMGAEDVAVQCALLPKIPASVQEYIAIFENNVPDERSDPEWWNDRSAMWPGGDRAKYVPHPELVVGRFVPPMVAFLMRERPVNRPRRAWVDYLLLLSNRLLLARDSSLHYRARVTRDIRSPDNQ